MGEGTQVAPITLTIELPRAREVAQVLPWVLHALEDRPGLSAKQRKRRQDTTSALTRLLNQLTERLQAYGPTTDTPEPGP